MECDAEGEREAIISEIKVFQVELGPVWVCLVSSSYVNEDKGIFHSLAIAGSEIVKILRTLFFPFVSAGAHLEVKGLWTGKVIHLYYSSGNNQSQINSEERFVIQQ
jgi:hypothetical protein